MPPRLSESRANLKLFNKQRRDNGAVIADARWWREHLARQPKPMSEAEMAEYETLLGQYRRDLADDPEHLPIYLDADCWLGEERVRAGTLAKFPRALAKHFVWERKAHYRAPEGSEV